MLIVRGHHSALKTSTWRHGVVHLAPAWCLSLLVTTPPLLGWGRYAPEGSDAISCSVDWLMTTPNALSYMVFLFLVGFFVPLLVIIGSFASIAQMIYKANDALSLLFSSFGFYVWVWVWVFCFVRVFGSTADLGLSGSLERARTS